jgi:hypothetical protein
MQRIFISAIVLIAFLAIGCAPKLTDAQAESIMQGVATELVKLEGASAESKMDKVKLVCDQQGVKVEAFSRYLHDNKGADEKMATIMTGILEKNLAESKQQLAAELAKVNADAQKAVAETKAGLEKKAKDLLDKGEQDLATKKAEFEKKQKELQETIAKVRSK